MTQDAKGQDDPKKGATNDDPKKGGADDSPQIDPKISEIMKDPDAVSGLLEAKRKANAEAKQFRERLEKLEREQAERDEAKLKEDGKFKEVAEKNEAKLKEMEVAFKTRAIRTALTLEAVKEGIVDPEAIALAKTDGLKVDEDFNVSGVAEAIKELKKAKPYLFKAGDGKDVQPPPGDGTPRPSLHDRVVKPDDDKTVAEARIARHFESKAKKG